MIYDQRNYIVGVAFSTCKVQRVYGSSIQQASNPKLLRVWFVKYKVPVKVTDRASTGEVHIRNLGKHRRRSVVDVA